MLLLLPLLMLLLLLLPVSVVMAIKRGVLNKYESARRIQASADQSWPNQTRTSKTEELTERGNKAAAQCCSFASAEQQQQQQQQLLHLQWQLLAGVGAAAAATVLCASLDWLFLPGSQLQMACLDAWPVGLGGWRTCCRTGHRLALPGHDLANAWSALVFGWIQVQKKNTHVPHTILTGHGATPSSAQTPPKAATAHQL